MKIIYAHDDYMLIGKLVPFKCMAHQLDETQAHAIYQKYINEMHITR